MKKELGLWIDHRQAVIVTLHDTEAEIKRINSNIEDLRDSNAENASGSGESHNHNTEDQRNHYVDEQLRHYYDAVIAAMVDSTSILILGPGEAKIELQNRLEAHGSKGRTLALETTDKMSDEQIVTEVRLHFQDGQKGSNNSRQSRRQRNKSTGIKTPLAKH